MAEAVVRSVFMKLAELETCQKALFQYGIREKVMWAQRELQLVADLLKDGEAQEKRDLRFKAFAEAVTGMANLIEDAFEEFFVEMGGDGGLIRLKEEDDQAKAKAAGGSFGRLQIKNLRTELKLKALIARLGSKIDRMKKGMNEIRESLVNYGITNLETPVHLARPRFVFPNIDRTEVVGFEDEFNNILNQLLDQSVSRRSVVSIAGPGGRGKTTLCSAIFTWYI